MSTRFSNILSFILLCGLIYFSFFDLMPHSPNNLNAKKTVFSTARAFQHVEQLAKFPHSIGTRTHSLVRNYIVSELQEMGLEVQTQQGYALNNYGVLSAPQNIITKIEGTDPSKKALLLLSHYDSAVHSSFGASDDGSGIATVLEGIRAFLAQGKSHENDIIILFSDAEEIGLLGAELFVKKHPWAKNVGLVLNFEARGSGGPSNMIVETNGGNSEMISSFIAANPAYPVATSLMYSVYKMLPNDTDSTIFREEEDIPSFFFAFIDDHYDYHTALDIPKNLNKNSLAHQGSYLMPLLDYFSNADLNQLGSKTDDIYFDFPGIDMIHYPFNWIFPLLGLAIIAFGLLLFIGFRKYKLELRPVLVGFIPFLGSLIVSGAITFLGWKLLLVVYPQYQEILQGFTYNGHSYIAAFVLLSLGVTFFFYNKFQASGNPKNVFIAPLFFWIVINILLAFYLKGATYFIIPVFLGLISLGILLWKPKPNLLLMLLLAIPAIFIFAPLIQFFPVGLGLKMLVVSSIFVVLLVGLLLPVLGFYRQKGDFVFVFLVASVVFFTIAHFNSEFSEEHPKPNSLVYVQNADNNQAHWKTYDTVLDDWTTAFLSKNPQKTPANLTFESKYASNFTYSQETENKLIPKSSIFISKDASKSEHTTYHLNILPQRNLNRISLFTDKDVNFSMFKANGLEANSIVIKGKKQHIFKNRFQDRLLTYYMVNQDTLRLDFTVRNDKIPFELVLFEASNDLLKNEQFAVPARSPAMIPKPFVLNDAIMVKQTISVE